MVKLLYNKNFIHKIQKTNWEYIQHITKANFVNLQRTHKNQEKDNRKKMGKGYEQIEPRKKK